MAGHGTKTILTVRSVPKVFAVVRTKPLVPLKLATGKLTSDGDGDEKGMTRQGHLLIERRYVPAFRPFGIIL